MRRPFVLPILILFAIAVAACGYFNSLYNAQRAFDEARRAERRGEDNVAAASYAAAIEDAASSWRSHRDGRWADDALMLIGRARFALRDYEASRAAFITLLQERPDGGLGASAHAWLGASEAALGNMLVARSHLDTALAGQPDREAEALALLWRARVRSELDEEEPAWTDLDAAAASRTVFAAEASITLAGRAIEAGDSARARVAFDRLLRDRAATRWSDSIATLIDAANGTFGPSFARSAIEPVRDGDWPAESREPHLLYRARLAAVAGDTAAAIADALALADNATPATRARARIEAARYRMAGVDDVAQLEEVRAMLLPVIDNGEARQLVRTVRAIDVLLGRALDGGEPLAVFAAAEWARDQLGAPALARRLFLTYADIAPAAVWAPKALLAAAALDAGGEGAEEIAARIAERPDNVYARAVTGGPADAAAFETAELRLDRTLRALRNAAVLEADARDVRVGAAVARIDSLRAIALADSTRIACGILLDSLALTGIRSDSVRAACMRSDSTRVAEVLRIDTLMLVDTSAAARDTSRVAGAREGWSPFQPAGR